MRGERARRWLVPAKEGVVAQRKPVQGAFKQKRPWDIVRRCVVYSSHYGFHRAAKNTALSRVFHGSRARLVLVYAGSGGSRGASQRLGQQRTRSRKATEAERNDLEGPRVAMKRVDGGGLAGSDAINSHAACLEKKEGKI